MYQPLAEILRPIKIDDVIGQKHLIGEGKPLSILAQNKPQSIILWGPPWVGKTTIANILADSWDDEVIKLSAVFSGIKEIKEALEIATRNTTGLLPKTTVLFVDEIHRFNISSSHGEMTKVQGLLNRIATFFTGLKAIAEQLTNEQRWYRILSKALEKYLGGRKLQPPLQIQI